MEHGFRRSGRVWASLLDLFELYRGDVMRSWGRLAMLVAPVALAVGLAGTILALDRGVAAYSKAISAQFITVTQVVVVAPPPSIDGSWRITELRAKMAAVGATVAPRAGENVELVCAGAPGNSMIFSIESLENAGGRRTLPPFDRLQPFSAENAAEIVLSEMAIKAIDRPSCKPELLVFQPTGTARLRVRVVGRLQGDSGVADIFAPVGLVAALKRASAGVPLVAADGKVQLEPDALDKILYDDVSVFAAGPSEKELAAVDAVLGAAGYAYKSTNDARTARRIQGFAARALAGLALLTGLLAMGFLIGTFQSIFDARRQEFLELRLLGINVWWGISSCMLQALTLGVIGGLIGKGLAQAAVLTAQSEVYLLQGHPLLLGTFAADLHILLPVAAAAPLVASLFSLVAMYRSNPAEAVAHV